MENLLAKRLAPLNLRGPLGWPEDPQTCGSESVDDPGDERCFRSDDREIDLTRARQFEQCGDVGGRNGHIFRDACRTGVARGDKHLGTILNEFPGERMFPTAVAYDENPARSNHGACSCGGWCPADIH